MQSIYSRNDNFTNQINGLNNALGGLFQVISASVTYTIPANSTLTITVPLSVPNGYNAIAPYHISSGNGNISIASFNVTTGIMTLYNNTSSSLNPTAVMYVACVKADFLKQTN